MHYHACFRARYHNEEHYSNKITKYMEKNIIPRAVATASRVFWCSEGIIYASLVVDVLVLEQILEIFKMEEHGIIWNTLNITDSHTMYSFWYKTPRKKYNLSIANFSESSEIVEYLKNTFVKGRISHLGNNIIFKGIKYDNDDKIPEVIDMAKIFPGIIIDGNVELEKNMVSVKINDVGSEILHFRANTPVK